MTRRLLTGSAALALAGGLLTATAPTAVGATSTRAPAVPQLDWAACGAGLEGFECATAELPTDYDDPRGPTTTIALTRLPAEQPDQRLGSLFTNPGGPGGSGVDFVQQAGRVAYPQSVRDRYDIIGFDPRGVGASDPATCYASAAEETAALSTLPGFPVTKADTKTYLPRSAALARSCRATSGDRISHASTANVARDMDLLRRAVGDEKLTYFGYSYGTYLGATYARLFPQKVGRMVLDGTIDPVAYSGANRDPRSVGVRTGQGPAAAETFRQFLRTCEEAGDACALNALGSPADVVEETFDRLRTETVDVPVGDGTTVPFGYREAVVLAFQSLYSPAQWTDLATSLAFLATGGTGDLPEAAPEMMRRAEKESRGEDYVSVGGNLASVCVDSEHRLPPSQYQRVADAEDRRAPDFGRFRAWVGVECAVMKLADEDAYRGPWKQSTKAPVLVIGTRYDPATPYRNTAPYTRLFPQGRMLTVEGYGHTIIGKSACADEAAARYLLGGDLPAVGTTCEQDIAPFEPVPAVQKRLAEAVPTV